MHRSLLVHTRQVAAHALIACMLPFVAGVARAQQTDALPIDAALAQPEFPSYMPISISPDGRAVAYTVCVPDVSGTADYANSGTSSQARGCSAWITQAGTLTRLGGGVGTAAWAPQWSPDGSKVAFFSDKNGIARLWIWTAATKSATPVSDAIVRPFAALEVPRWMPDSRGVVTRILPYGEPVTSASLSPPAAGVSWDTAGREPGSTVKVYRTDSAWRSQPRYLPPTVALTEAPYAADLALIHVQTGVVQTLARGYKPYSYWVSPSGEFVVFTSEHGVSGEPVNGGGSFRDDLVVVRTDSGNSAPHVIADRAAIVPFATGVSWSPDGHTIVYATADATGAERYHLVLTRDWSERTFLAPDSIRSVLTGRGYAQPLRWDRASKVLFVTTDSLVATLDVVSGQWRALSHPPHGVSIVALVGREARSDLWEPDGESIVVQSRNDSTKYMGFATINVRNGRWTQVTNKAQYLGSKTFALSDVSADERHVAFIAESATEPPDIWITEKGLDNARRVSAVAPALEGRHYGESRLIAWRTARGETARGALLLPSGYEPGHAYPLIIYPYPTDRRSNSVYQFGLRGAGVENMQLFATRGYAVLAPDAAINVADQMRSLADVLLPGVDRVIAMGIADSNRLGVMGHSWGGYTVLALLVQTQRFRAAVMRGGVGDLFDYYSEMQPDGATYGQFNLEAWLGASPWSDQARYIDNSPVFFLDRVRTPLLIIHGGADSNLPPHNGSQVFAELRRLGQPVEFALYDGEGHGEIGWSIANRRDYLSRVIGWFGEYLDVRGRDGRQDGDPKSTAP
jgi:dipeptidyl aminopeptidase/acylaminoacyl peptidase